MRHLLRAICLLFLALPAQADTPRVATDIRPVQALVARVMAGLGVPSVLIRPGHEPQDYRLRASEITRLSHADIVFWVGPELTPVLANAISMRGDQVISVPLLRTHHTRLLRYRTPGMFADDTHAGHVVVPSLSGHGDHDSHDASHGMAPIDAHAWLDPDNAKIWVDEIAMQLSKIDAANADTYLANAWHAKKEIDQAVADVRATLAPFMGTPFVVYHDSYHYFEAFFDVRASAAVYLSQSQAPARVSEVRALLLAGGIPCAYVDPRFGDRTMREVTRETGTSLYFLDPLGVYLPSGPNFYTNMLRGLAEDFAACQQATN